MSVSVVIVTYEVLEDLKACLSSLAGQDPSLIHEIIVVDNHSQDGTPDWIRAERKDIRLLVNDKNMGFPAACNQAAGVASGDFLLFLNPDTQMEPDALRLLYEAASEDGLRTCLGPRILDQQGRTLLACQRRSPNLFDVISQMALWHRWGRGFQSEGRFQKATETQCLQGSCMFVLKKQFDQLQGFDQRIPMYMEDMDFCRRVLCSGGKVYYVADSVVHHAGGNSTSRLSDPRVTGLMRILAFDAYFKEQGSRKIRKLHRLVQLLFSLLVLPVDVLLFLPLTIVGQSRLIGGYLRQHVCILELILTGKFTHKHLPEGWPNTFIP